MCPAQDCLRAIVFVPQFRPSLRHVRQKAVHSKTWLHALYIADVYGSGNRFCKVGFVWCSHDFVSICPGLSPRGGEAVFGKAEYFKVLKKQQIPSPGRSLRQYQESCYWKQVLNRNRLFNPFVAKFDKRWNRFQRRVWVLLHEFKWSYSWGPRGFEGCLQIGFAVVGNDGW